MGKKIQKKKERGNYREHCSSAQRVYSVFNTVDEVWSSGKHKWGRMSVSGVRRLPKCDTFMDRIFFFL